MHGIIDALDGPAFDGEGEGLEVGDAAGEEGRQRQRPLQPQGLIAQKRKGNLQALGHLALIGCGLRREAEDLGSHLPKAVVKIAETFGLQRRAMGAGNVVPAGRIGQARPAGPGVAEDNGPALAVRQIHRHPGGCGQAEVGQAPAALEMPGGAIILGWGYALTHAGRGLLAGWRRGWGRGWRPTATGATVDKQAGARGQDRPATWLAGRAAAIFFSLTFAAARLRRARPKLRGHERWTCRCPRGDAHSQRRRPCGQPLAPNLGQWLDWLPSAMCARSRTEKP